MRIFDETTGQLRELELRPRMGLYVCGITPYDSSHLGHAFTYVHFDVLARYLRHLGSEVIHVQNITDVDDDILRVAKERDIDYQELATQECASFERAMRSIGIAEPTHSPRATEFVPQIVEEVAALLRNANAYERDGNVYFSVRSDPDYGKLSRLDRERMVALAEERGGHPEDPRKDDPLDFVLWQRSLPDEPSWPSPWGDGRPGWHIECSTMARRLIGQPIDVHGGGNDLVFPHHESEIAQAECIDDRRPFVRHWMHTGMVGMSGEKMSKSLGNLAFVDELVDRYDAHSLRRYLLRRHYRDDWTFDEDELAREAKGETRSDRYAGASADQLRDELHAALDDDLDTPRAMEVLDAAEASPHATNVADEARSVLGFDF